MDLQWKALLTQFVGFLVVLWLLRRYAWERLLNFVEHRRETIRAEFTGIEKAKSDVDALRRKYDEELAGIEAARRARIQEAAHEANRLASEIRDEARREVVGLRVKANQDIEIEMEKANAVFRDRIVESVIVATEKLIRERLDDRKHRQLVSEFLDEVGAGPGRR